MWELPNNIFFCGTEQILVYFSLCAVDISFMSDEIKMFMSVCVII